MWSSNFVVEVVVKFGVLLAIPRNERNLASCSVLTCAFCAKLFIERDNGHVPYYTLPLYDWTYIYSYRSPQRKIQKEHMLLDSSSRNILCHLRVKGLFAIEARIREETNFSQWEA